jgi:hypothetical protein
LDAFAILGGAPNPVRLLFDFVIFISTFRESAKIYFKGQIAQAV